MITEEFSSLSISVSLSADNNKPSYPRGIVNPNYPGFQHLAHTLTEQFVDPHGIQTESMSDSDFSEVDSDFPSECHSAENNNIHAGNDDSNGNKIVEADVKSSIDNLSTVEEILRTVFESNSNHLSSAINMFTEKELVSKQTEIECINEVNACNLEAYLEHYDDGGINIENAKPLINTKSAPASIVIEPDVIRKSSSCECGFEQTADKPDILLDVTEAGPAALSGEKDEPGSVWSITPVDIVGNFEQEVERELGLLVTGYRNTTFKTDSDAVDGAAAAAASPEKLTGEKFLHKIADATLSSANDTISMASTCQTKNPIPTAIVKPKYQKSSFDDRQLPTVVYMNEDKTAWYDKTNINNEPSNGCASTATAAAEISTQPKKIHLPDFERKLKKHTKSMTAMTTTTVAGSITATALSITKFAHNTNVDTAARNNQRMQTDNMENGASDRNESVCSVVTNRNSVVKKSMKIASSASGTKLAVVQPRKKERMDQTKLMETIVQMQIKKNAQLYRNQGNITKSNTTIMGATSTEMPQTDHANKNSKCMTKYLNNNNTTTNNKSTAPAVAAAHNRHNNNNGENRMHTERNQTKRDQKENSGMSTFFPMQLTELAQSAIHKQTHKME